MDIEYWVLATLCGVISISTLSSTFWAWRDGAKLTQPIIIIAIVMGIALGATVPLVVQNGYEQRVIDKEKSECITKHNGFWVNNQCYTGRIEI